ncbi:hypothetical protein V8D89_007075 [Ganoderma adspersum]
MPVISHILQLAIRSTSVISEPLTNAGFDLDSSGVAGFFGGESAVSGMATVNLIPNRRWGGWYNSPGSYEIAKHFTGASPIVPNGSGSCYGLSYVNRDGSLFDNRNIVVLKGPEGAVNAVTQGRFLLQYRGQQDGESELKPAHGPPKSPDMSLEMEMEALLGEIEEERSKAREGDDGGLGEGDERKRRTTHTGENNHSELPGAWNALAEVLWDRLEIFLSPTKRFIGFSSFLLTVQFLAQLLLIPQGELFGQLMFVTTLAFSWAYNSYLSSLDRDDLQTTILFDILGLDQGGSIKKYQLSSWTASMVFTYLSLQARHSDTSVTISHAPKILDEMIPNDTEVWKLWKRAVAEKISTKQRLQFTKQDWSFDHLNHDEKKLLREFLKDAMVAGRAWEDVWSRRPSTAAAVQT